MKYLLLIAIVLLVAWLWRGNRQQDRATGGSAARRPPQVAQQEMIECPVCSVHVPRSDALPGPDGQFYCCAEHRSRAAG
ncbi:PP0621 family protein [Ramlibacter sp.]|uniref:PP0621 family protein n=1 Tax=Ramlibacter sp. TaxID=1917967 RepID=UPI002CC3F85A|nr:PP0621 family protein [Ramlibacter sp.]HWI84405.1 PP0621 family protein [Ramlibacter sp.]